MLSLTIAGVAIAGAGVAITGVSCGIAGACYCVNGGAASAGAPVVVLVMLPASPWCRCSGCGEDLLSRAALEKHMVVAHSGKRFAFPWQGQALPCHNMPDLAGHAT